MANPVPRLLIKSQNHDTREEQKLAMLISPLGLGSGCSVSPPRPPGSRLQGSLVVVLDWTTAAA